MRVISAVLLPGPARHTRYPDRGVPQRVGARGRSGTGCATNGGWIDSVVERVVPPRAVTGSLGGAGCCHNGPVRPVVQGTRWSRKTVSVRADARGGRRRPGHPSPRRSRRCRSGRPWRRARRRRRRRPPAGSPRPRRRRREAMTGTVTAARTSRIRSRSKPACVPSASIALSRISPAPELGAAGGPGDRVEPGRLAAAVGGDLEARVGARRRDGRRPTARAPGCRTGRRSRPTSSGRWIAAVLTATLSAPARSSRSTSSTAADSPADGQRDEHLLGRARDDLDASSRGPRGRPRCRGRSARRRPRRRTAGPARPGRRRRGGSRKFTPFTTRPASTSRHGITRTARLTRARRPGSASSASSSVNRPS